MRTGYSGIYIVVNSQTAGQQKDIWGGCESFKYVCSNLLLTILAGYKLPNGKKNYQPYQNAKLCPFK